MSLQERRQNDGNPVLLEAPETQTHSGSASLSLTVDEAGDARELRAVLLDGEQRPMPGVELQFGSWRWALKTGKLVTDSRGEAVSVLSEPPGGLPDLVGEPDLAWVHGPVMLATQVVIPRAQGAVAWRLAPVPREDPESQTHTQAACLTVSFAQERGAEKVFTLEAVVKDHLGLPLRDREVQFAPGVRAFEPVGRVKTGPRGEAQGKLTVAPGGGEDELVVPVRATVVLRAEVDLLQVGSG